MENDLEHLKLLSIFHYVVAGITALIACFPIIHLVIGLSMLTGKGFYGEQMTGVDVPFPFSAFGLIFTILPLVMILAGWGLAVCLVLAGRNLMIKKEQNFLHGHRRYKLCFRSLWHCVRGIYVDRPLKTFLQGTIQDVRFNTARLKRKRNCKQNIVMD